jgi:hypothetical protein
MLTHYLLEAENAAQLRKSRADAASTLDAFKNALAPDQALVIGGEPGANVVPFRKAQPSPSPQRPRPPVQQPLRPAAIVTASDVFNLFKTDRPAFDAYLAKVRQQKVQR